MVTIKSPLPLILCCYLLVSFVFFPHGALSRQLQGEGGGNKRSKADVKRSTSRSAPSWVGQDSHPPPSSQVSRTSSSSSQSTVVEYSRQDSNSPTGPGWNCQTTTTSNGYARSCSKTTYQSSTSP
ncbi:hypothetical protein E1A91_D13G031300v1 [Gossypium mustelinum]|nr:uncharacterized protein LOC105784163 [Gossypium raimondii]KJB79040.1 hypothetical protein B456_013G030800 [Gossypium raimondii]TYI45360.1 hypothetical protein E1A91_D13G031300v1 [Gossypium mustelinum]